MTLKLGFIGVGFIAQQCHLPAFDHRGGACIHAVSDLHEDLAEKIGARYEVDNVYKNHRDLLKSEEIDGVVITLPRRLTTNVVAEALNADKHVFTEKPLALGLETGSELVRLAESKRKVLYVGYMKHHDAGYLNLLERVRHRKARGELPILIRSNCYMGDSYASPFGDFKSSNKELMSLTRLEDMPAWLAPDLENGYENHLNVYSHVIGLLSEITASDWK